MKEPTLPYSRKKPLRIGLDYDDTYTACPQLFDAFVEIAHLIGHEVTFVTARSKRMDNTDLESVARRLGTPIVYTGPDQKSDHFEADIVIDDMPARWPSAPMLRMMLAAEAD